MIQKSTHHNLIAELNTRFGFSLQDIQLGIADRVEGVDADVLDVKKWLDNVDTIPSWANRGAAHWIIELWMSERDACEPNELLVVDKKYTRLLKHFSMGEIIAMRNEIIRRKSG
ncbi:hypothetical protein [Kaarinaea lacus]